MKIEPPRRFRSRPVALVFPGSRSLRIITQDQDRLVSGSRAVNNALATLAGHVVYAESGLGSLRHTTGATSWTLSTWRGRQTRMVHNPTGVAVTSLRGCLEGSDDPWEELQRALRWLRGYGVSPGSLSSMAWALWRSSLPGEVVIGAEPSLGRSALYGGRQEITEPRTYQHMVAADITAAYPHSMAQAHDYALSLRSVHRETVLDPQVAGLARARVYVPHDLPYAPLPVRIAPQIIQFQHGTIEGIWPWCELAAAANVGAEVEVEECWAPRRTADLFGAWWPMVMEGRALGGGAGQIAKSISNSLWGQFGMVGDDRAEVHWADEAGQLAYEVAQPERTMPHAWTAHVAAETTARVRARLLTEGLYGSQFRPVHVDTDGIIVRRRAALPGPEGSGPGTWRVKQKMAKVDVRAPQLYRFTCGRGCGVDHPKWHHVASGLSANQAPEYFDRAGHLRTRISYRAQFDTCLPPGHAADLEGRSRAMVEAIGLGAI